MLGMSTPTSEQHLRTAIGARIARLRRERSITQEQLAERVDAASQTIRRIERGHTTPPLGRLLDIAEALGVQMLDLFEAEDAPVTEPVRDMQEAMVVDLYRATPDNLKSLLVSVAESFAAQN
jgi:transcriptional regulator with XRE-family HTH domain